GASCPLACAPPTSEPPRHVLSQAFPVNITRNLAGARWSKLAMNCAMSTLGAVSGLSLGELAGRRAVRSLALEIISEVVQAAKGRGIRMEPIAGIRPDQLVRLPRPIAHAV